MVEQRDVAPSCATEPQGGSLGPATHVAEHSTGFVPNTQALTDQGVAQASAPEQISSSASKEAAVCGGAAAPANVQAMQNAEAAPSASAANADTSSDGVAQLAGTAPPHTEAVRQPLPALGAPRPQADRRRTLARCAALLAGTALIPALVCGVLYGWAIWRYGSTAKALARLKGQVLFVEPPGDEMATVPAGVTLTSYRQVENLTGRPVTIVGSKSGCGCVVAQDLPISLGPYARQTIGISAIVTPPKRGDEFAQALQLCLDTPSAPVVVLVRAKVVQEAAE